MKRLLLSIAFLFTMLVVQANNIQVTNMSLTGQNTSSKFTLVQFTVGWENSWRDNVNWDAAWVFVKYRVPGGSGGDNNWRHATLSATAAQHTAPTGATINPTSDGVGAFLYRSSNGGGTINYTNVQLRWNYGTNLKSNTVGNFVGDNDQVEVQVYAIEMVYVPQGAYYLGDGNTTNLMGEFESANTAAPYLVAGENAITLGGNGPGSLGNRSSSGMANADDFSGSVSRTLPAGFPKGFRGFYCQKHETSQKQYVDFLNSLTFTQAESRKYTSTNAAQGNVGGAWPNFFSNDPFIPVVVGYQFSCSYLDWAGLRLMTELEYEKACRGDQLPVVQEFAWGNGTLVQPDAIANNGLSNMSVTTLGANVSMGTWTRSTRQAPLRSGIFATSNSTRQLSGASYWGILDLTGNLWETAISVGKANSRTFEGTHGDGLVNTNGNATNGDWPGFDGSSVIAYPTPIRGGSWSLSQSAQGSKWDDNAKVSNRGNVNYTGTPGGSDIGFRGVRTNP